MGVLGTVILAFLIIHLSDFWYKAHFEGNKDLYSLVIEKFQNIYYVMIYVIAMLAILLHLLQANPSLGLFNFSKSSSTLTSE